MLGQQQLLQSSLGELLNLLYGFELFVLTLFKACPHLSMVCIWVYVAEFHCASFQYASFIDSVWTFVIFWMGFLPCQLLDFIFELLNKTGCLLICLALVVGPDPQLGSSGGHYLLVVILLCLKQPLWLFSTFFFFTRLWFYSFSVCICSVLMCSDMHFGGNSASCILCGLCSLWSPNVVVCRSSVL